ncbi:MAG: hypothetical protein AB1505_06760 [Candidatus Latescibacterota bacterium]
MTFVRNPLHRPRDVRIRALLPLLFAAGVCTLVGCAAAQPMAPQAGPLRKKLVEYGWDVPPIEFVAEHIRDMEQLPFDGIVFRLRGLDHAFDTQPWPADSLDAQVATLKRIDWQNFTDNFLCLYSADFDSMDWFDDGQWRTITRNLRGAAQAARQARCVGICFDPEPYGPSPWTMPAGSGPADFARASAQARQRGAQFISALQEGLPGLKLLTLYQVALFAQLADEEDPERRQQLLASHGYALYLPFIDGMLDAMAPNTRLIDGNESSYYYEGSGPYYRAYHAIRQGVLPLVFPANRRTYRAQVDVGVALYVDQVLGLRGPAVRFLSHFLEPEDQLRWFEHNVYWALETSDEYVWCYSERMNWWKGEFMPGLDEAIRTARRKLEAPGTADVQIEPTLARARARMDEELASRLVRRTAAVAPLAAGVAPPAMDGALQEAAWRIEPLAAFLPPVDTEGQPQGTTAWVTHDDQALYVALRCAEPDSTVAAGRLRDDEVWNGDTVELFLSLGDAPEPYAHFILNPDNVQWDGMSGGQIGDSSWDGSWRSAVGREPGAWAAELAIPWADVGGAPAPGSRRHANLCRQRMQGGQLSTWSMVVQGFIEPAHFGVWEFAGSAPAARQAEGAR